MASGAAGMCFLAQGPRKLGLRINAPLTMTVLACRGCPQFRRRSRMTSITPPELHGLLAIAREEGLDMKPVLLRVLTDLYISVPHHSPDEILQFREIAGQMIPHVDEPTALIVACKLAAYPHTPVELAGPMI